MESQLVVFDISNEHYGVDIAAVEGIIKMQPITAVPRAPSFVEGVTNLRGKVLPVIDLRKRFGLMPIPREADNSPEQKGAVSAKDMRIVVVEIGGQTVGMIVDAVSEVLRIDPEAVEPPSPIVTTVDSAFIQGIAKAGERLIILLNLEQVLSGREAESLRTVPQAA